MANTNRAVDEIFAEALQRPAQERSAYLDVACANNPEMRQRVERLLRAHGDANSFLESPAGVSNATLDQPRTSELPGTQIGPYKLLQQIGEGGMGTVFMAEQSEPVQRRVALKIIKLGMDSRQVIARFAAEKQALALMDHVNIARVLDAGVTEQGRPYFVMELIHGVPITKYCDDNHLTPRQRLELFVPVCQAIQHAHQKGIIHRDIKPSNVMITLYDGKPAPKVIDFGVAKAMDQKLTEQTLFTQYGTMIGTLQYMSPEQAEMSALGVDTRSDIYSLGVLLYELLTGSTPLSRQQMKEAAYGEILRLIRDVEPPKPSTRLSESGESLASISAQRQTEPAKLSKLMRGELDWIVMKTLEKDRNRRYETASGFAADVHRYLNDEPVQACPPSAAYRVRKFARRNKAALTTASVVAVAVLLAVASVGWAVRDRAAREEELGPKQAAREVEIVREREAREQEIARDRETQRLLVEGSAKLWLDLSDEHLQEGKWKQSLVEAQRAESVLGSGSASNDLRQRLLKRLADLQMVLRLEELRTLGPGEPVTYDIHSRTEAYGRTFRDYGIDIEVLDLKLGAEAIRRAAIRLELVFALDNWAKRGPLESQADAALRRRKLLAIARAADSDDWRNRVRELIERGDASGLVQLAESPQATQQPSAALLLLAGALADFDQRNVAAAMLLRAQSHHRDDLRINVHLGLLLLSTKPPRPDDAIRFNQAALALQPQSGGILNNLGNALQAKGCLDEAIEAYRESILLAPYWAGSRGNLGNALGKKGEHAAAIVSYGEAVRLEPKNASRRNGLSWLLATSSDMQHRDPPRAVELAREAVALDPQEGSYWNTLGVAQYRAGDWKGAIVSLSKSQELAGEPARVINGFFLAMAHWQLGNKVEAREWYDKSTEWMAADTEDDGDLIRFRGEVEKTMGIENLKP